MNRSARPAGPALLADWNDDEASDATVRLGTTLLAARKLLPARTA